MKRRKTRLLMAAVDIGWRMDLYSKWVDEHLGDRLDVESFVKYKLSETQYPTRYTFAVQYSSLAKPVQWMHALGFFFFALFRYDVFHFLSGETLLTRRLRRLELSVYRLLGKRVIMHFVGADIRDPAYVVWKEQRLLGDADAPSEHPVSAPWQLRLIDDAERYADEILVSTPDLLAIIPTARYLPVVLDLEKFDEECASAPAPPEDLPADGDVTVLHAPSNVAMKGTALLKRALETLEVEDPALRIVLTSEFGLETGSRYTVPRLMLFGLYDEADILVDQLTIGWYGLQSVEALMRGCQVVCGIDESLVHLLGDDCPIVPADAENPLPALRRAVNAARSGAVDPPGQRAWVERNHTMDRWGPLLADMWLGEG